jgi:rod shape determining protein RodA
MANLTFSRTGHGGGYHHHNRMLQVDWLFVGLLCALTGIGILMLYSVGGMSWQPWAYKQLTFFTVFLAGMIVLGLLDLRIWLFSAYWIYGICLLLLVGVEVMGDIRGGSQRWLTVGPLTFQPSEYMRLAIVLALAKFYHECSGNDASLSWKLLIPVAMIVAPVTLVMHQPDLGTAVLISLTGATVMILAGLNWKLIAGAAIAAAISVPVAFQFVLHDYQKQRITTLLNPDGDPSGAGYHILQSKIAMGSGGLMGKGIGLGSQSQLDFLPEKHTDFIMAAVSEELGFAGAAVVFGLCALIVGTCMRIASQSHSHFGRLAAAGATATFAIYVLINGAMVMGLFPVVGVPMPLVSYGGSAMMMIMTGFGLVLGVRVNRHQEMPRKASVFQLLE